MTRRKKNISKLIHKKESYEIRGTAFDIYKEFRSSHKEKIYRDAFCIALTKKGFQADKEKRVDIFYSGKTVGTCTPDIVVNGIIFIELKAKPVLSKQAIEHLSLS